MVRVYDVPRDRIEVVRAMGDYRGLNWRENYLILEVDANGHAALEAAGFRVASDPARSRALEAFRDSDPAAWHARGLGGIPGYPCYRTVTETHSDLAALAAAHPGLARWISIGRTWQDEAGNPGGDEIFVLVLGNEDSPWPRAPLVLMGAQHARELVTAETAARFGEWLIEGFAEHPEARWLLDHREIHIIAQQNPDGRRQVEQGQASWRKNFNGTACPDSVPGVDLNRNSAFFWGSFSSGTPCHQTYRGPAVASEPETHALQDYLEEVFERQRPAPDLDSPAPDDARGIFISLHSSGEMVLLPWEGLDGENENNAPNHDGLTILGRKFGFFTGYAVARWQLLPPAGGTSVDFAYGEFGVASYTFEQGTDQLQDCASFEDTIWPDHLAALVYAAKAAERPYLAPSGPEITALVVSESDGVLHLSGTADDTRYFRGPITEPPEGDPVFDVVEVLASVDLPPAQAPKIFALELSAVGPVTGFSGTIELAGGTGAPQLVFVRAADHAGNTGVATAEFFHTDVLFRDRFGP